MSRRGFTLLEATIGGAVLMLGMIMIAQLTRTALDVGGTANPQAAQDTMAIEQYVQSVVARISGDRTAMAVPGTVSDTLAELRLPLADVYLANMTRTVEDSGVGAVAAPLNNAGITYSLVRYDLTFRQTVNNAARPQNAAADQIVAQTTFWKVGTSGATKIGL